MAVRPAPASTRHVLVRHGETAWNAQRRFTTRSDVPLSERGLAQARALADGLAEAALDAIYASPSARARVTAETIAAASPGRPMVVIDERLREIDAGPFEGLTPEEIEAGPLAEAYAAWHTDGEPVFPSGAETFDEAIARARAFLRDAAARPGLALVVSHGSLIRLVLAVFVLGAPPGRHRRLWLENGRFALVEWGTHPRLLAFNAVRLD